MVGPRVDERHEQTRLREQVALHPGERAGEQGRRNLRLPLGDGSTVLVNLDYERFTESPEMLAALGSMARTWPGERRVAALLAAATRAKDTEVADTARIVANGQ